MLTRRNGCCGARRIEQNDIELDDVISSDESSVQLESHRKTLYNTFDEPPRLCGRAKHPVEIHVQGRI